MSFSLRSFLHDIWTDIDIGQWVFILSLVGYPLVAATSEYFQMENRFLSIPFRAVILVLSLAIVFKSCITNRTNITSNLFSACWFLFWVLYLGRIFIDGRFDQSALKLDESEYWLNAIGICFFPAIASQIRCEAISRIQSLFLIVIIAAIGLASNLYIIFLTQGFNGLDELSSTRSETDFFNPISLGQLAVTLLILSFWAILNLSLGVIKRLFFISAICISIVGLLASGSRGPLLSLLCVILFYFYCSSLKSLIYGFVFVAVSTFLFVLLFPIKDSYLLERITTGFFEDSTRQSLASEGIRLAISHPLLGAGIEPLETYPHNLIIESFMVFGVFTGFCFCYLIFRSLLSAHRLCKVGSWVPLIYIQLLASGFVSGSLYSSPAFWISLVLVVGLERFYRTNRHILIGGRMQ